MLDIVKDSMCPTIHGSLDSLERVLGMYRGVRQLLGTKGQRSNWGRFDHSNPIA